ncbi:cardiolipin synthase [Aerococcus kribbianus]|uniref:Cardiolipin synthase n=1 Tax=Aerococcus kribbianus TaxID=2999064 RepID=A0A9X3FMM5_9LACT|nr:MULTISPECIES: cardiolipin synthase [unclassified Aerococcus]MCZ0717205.1 cardiolipin synthase [Aerococcus sp. YH-aer221]MCZ0725493.1 cardiolipin synthase [Aerococcus sp. YH-aer222]
MQDYILMGIGIFLLVNTILAVITVFKEPRPVTSIWAWLLVLNLIPGIGFIIYYFVGRKISQSNIFHLQTQEVHGMQDLIASHTDSNRKQKNLDQFPPLIQEMMTLLFRSDFSILTHHNQVDLYVDGDDKFAALVADLEAAQDFIHIQYYIFTDDEVGGPILDILERKAREGVEVRLLYDAVGSRSLRPKDLNALRDAGGQVSSFFSKSPFWIINFRLNFRNHRKIVVIDGQVGYVGGFNVAKEYIGKGPLGYWRDTHLRLRGNAVKTLESRFLMDWYASEKEKPKNFDREYFPEPKVKGDTAMQIVSSGPDEDMDQIKMGYIKMISLAQDHVYIQSPYFIPDESVFETIEIAALSGVDVRIMIPCKPDHPFVYRATEYYAKEILAAGAKIYTYDKGFLHAKTVMVDGKFASVGTANMDMRSFALNFEVNAFLYDRTIVADLETAFYDDIAESTQVDEEYFANQSRWKKFRQAFSRLLSPIL